MWQRQWKLSNLWKKENVCYCLLQDQIQCCSKDVTALTERAPQTSTGVARYGFLIIQSNLIYCMKGKCWFHAYLQLSVTCPDIQRSQLPWNSGKMATCWVNCVYACLVICCVKANKTQDVAIQSSCSKLTSRIYCTYEELSIVIDMLGIFEAFSVFKPSEVLYWCWSEVLFCFFVDKVLHLHRKKF